MDPAKVTTTVEWQTPCSLRDVQCFLGFANFYCKFIQDYSNLVLLLTQLTRKGQSFVWSEEADMAFESLKKAFTSAPILAHVDPEKPFIIEADVSDFTFGSILSQQGDDEKLHLVGFHSRKFDAAEINYEIHDKELLAIVDSFTQLEAFSRGIFSSSHHIQCSQKSCLLSECSCVKSTSSSVGPLPHAFRLQNYISSGEAPREGRCIITAFVSNTTSR